MNPPLTVLIVEDNPEFRMLYSRFFKKSADQPFDVIETGSLQEGLSAARQKKVDCALVDYHLPDGNGMEFITSFRQEGLSPQAALLLATGQENDEIAAEAVSHGAAGCLSKIGLTKDAFISVIMQAIEKSR